MNEKTVAKVFSKIKEKEIINQKIKLKVDRQPKNIVKSVKKDFADQMVYYRNLLGYSQKQVGQAIGVSEDSYRRYELKELEVTDLKKIKKIVKFLKFEEEPKLSEYVRFLMSNPKKQLEDYLKKNKISKNQFSKSIGISRRAILDWFSGKKTISRESYEKIKIFIRKSEKNREKEEDEEME